MIKSNIFANHDIPIPKKTLTAADPVTFPIELSAESSYNQNFQFKNKSQLSKPDFLSSRFLTLLHKRFFIKSFPPPRL